MLSQTPTFEEWWIDDQTPDNPFGRSGGYGTYPNSLIRCLTPALAAEPLGISVEDPGDHPDSAAAAVDALKMLSSVTRMKAEIVDDTPWENETGRIQVVGPVPGEARDGSSFSSVRHVGIGQRFHDAEPNLTDMADYGFDSHVDEFGHEFGPGHPGLRNAACRPGTVTRRSVQKGILAFTSLERERWSFPAAREAIGFVWRHALLRLAASPVRGSFVFDVINRPSEHCSFSPAT